MLIERGMRHVNCESKADNGRGIKGSTFKRDGALTKITLAICLSSSVLWDTVLSFNSLFIISYKNMGLSLLVVAGSFFTKLVSSSFFFSKIINNENKNKNKNKKLGPLINSPSCKTGPILNYEFMIHHMHPALL